MAALEPVEFSEAVQICLAAHMKISFAKSIGFCSGVKRAVLIAENALKEGKKPVFFLGSLVHNERVVGKFKDKGIRFINKLDDVKSGTVIIHAHGVPPVLKEINKNIVLEDATCPLVKKTQLVAESLFKDKYQVIIIGDKDHSETKGISGYARGKALIIEKSSEVEKLSFFKKIGVVAQTTQNIENVKEVLEKLKEKSKKIKFINTLCPEVQARQKELASILTDNDGILVIGSSKSANTKRLVETAEKRNKKVFFANCSRELKNLNNVKKLGVVSGTSTPDWVIKEISQTLLDLK
ncbi:MAG: 4-hydroxy-3-methylbut-2-enyl diphosphate reductase [Candidatus Pacebacteria bacterium]|nr:4-hydroxy-3-methylbut-2-enyl diphosphate reductase [Candidatus Paceibacterota bacterium]